MKIIAIDDDEKNTDNSKMAFKIKNITPLDKNKNISQALFTISDESIYSPAEIAITAGQNLQGYYGNYEILLEVNKMK